MIFPNIDPIALQIGPLVVRWYALAYIAGLLLGRWWGMRLAAQSPAKVTPKMIDDFLVWAVIGVIVGGRLGYVLFYQPVYFAAHPLEALQVWQGGMSFHGGLLGVIAALILFTRKRKISLLPLTDIIAAVAPLGLLLGRLANFINQELWGRVTDVPWAVVFPLAGPEPRHPSQLYEAALEGLLLFLLLHLLVRRTNALARPGLMSGAFLTGYGTARIFAELFRQPDVFIGFLSFGTTWGQWLSLPMIIIGLWLMRRAVRQPPLHL